MKRYQIATLDRKQQLRAALIARAGMSDELLEDEVIAIWGGKAAMANTLWTLLSHLALHRQPLTELSSDQLVNCLCKRSSLADGAHTVENTFSEDARRTMKEYSKEVGAKLSNVVPSLNPDGQPFREKTYLNRMAKLAATRTAKTRPPGERKAIRCAIRDVAPQKEFANPKRLCEACQNPMTFIGHQKRDRALPGKERRNHVHNATLDARVLRRRGGQYTSENTALLCNLLKAGFPEDNAYVFIDDMRKADFIMVDGVMHPNPTLFVHVKIDLGAQDKELISA